MRSVVEILVDCSPAMGEELCSRRSKLDVVKRALEHQILPRLTDRLVGIRRIGDDCRGTEVDVVREPRPLAGNGIKEQVAKLDLDGATRPALHTALEAAVFSLYESPATRDLSKRIVVFCCGKNPCGFESTIPTVANAVRWSALRKQMQANDDLKIMCVALGRRYEEYEFGDEDIMARWDILLAGAKGVEQNLTAIEGFLSPLLGTPGEHIRGVDRFLPISWGQRRLEERFADMSEMQYGLADRLQSVLQGAKAKSRVGVTWRDLVVVSMFAVLLGVVGWSLTVAQQSFRGLAEAAGQSQYPDVAPGANTNGGELCALSKVELVCIELMNRAGDNAMKALNAHNRARAAGGDVLSDVPLGGRQDGGQMIRDIEP